MKKISIKLSLLLLVVIGFNACQPKLDTTSEESSKESAEAIMAKLDSNDKKKFLGAVFSISLSSSMDEKGSFLLSDDTDKAKEDSINSKLHGMTFKDVMAWNDEIDSEIEKRQLKYAYSKKAKAETFESLYDKVIIVPNKIEKDENFNDWVNMFYTYENNLPHDITAFNYKATYQLPDTLIVLNNIMNLTIDKNSKGSDKIFISDKVFEDLKNVDIANFTFEITAVSNYKLPDDEETIFDKNLFTDEDQELIDELSAKYPDIK